MKYKESILHFAARILIEDEQKWREGLKNDIAQLHDRIDMLETALIEFDGDNKIQECTHDTL